MNNVPCSRESARLLELALLHSGFLNLVVLVVAASDVHCNRPRLWVARGRKTLDPAREAGSLDVVEVKGVRHVRRVRRAAHSRVRQLAFLDGVHRVLCNVGS